MNTEAKVLTKDYKQEKTATVAKPTPTRKEARDKLEQQIIAGLEGKDKETIAKKVSAGMSKNKQLNKFLHAPFNVPTNLQRDKFEKLWDDMGTNGLHNPIAMKAQLEVAMERESGGTIEAIRKKFNDFIEDEDVREQFENKLAEYAEFLDTKLQTQLEFIYKRAFS